MHTDSPMYRLFLLPLLLLLACADNPPTTPETRPVENPNAGNTAIYDVDEDDPYEIGDGSFLDMRPGDPLAPFTDFLHAGQLTDGEGTFDVFYIAGRRDDTLGYVYSSDGSTVESIFINSPDAVTQQGIRVGNTVAELRERLGKLELYGTEIEARAYASKPPFRYRLGTNAAPGPIDSTALDPATEVVEIIIE